MSTLLKKKSVMEGCRGSDGCGPGDDHGPDADCSVNACDHRSVVNEKCSGTTNCQDPECTDTRRMECSGSCVNPLLRSSVELALAESVVWNYPFDQVKYRLVSEGVIPLELVDTAIREFRRYLVVILHATGSVGMISPIVDEVWHAFILHTKDYADFCNDMSGEYLHHAPNTPMSPSEPTAVPNFVNGYNKLFGDLDPIWTMHHMEQSMCMEAPAS